MKPGPKPKPTTCTRCRVELNPTDDIVRRCAPMLGEDIKKLPFHRDCYISYLREEKERGLGNFTKQRQRNVRDD